MHSIVRLYALRAVAAGGIGIGIGAAARRLPQVESARKRKLKLTAPWVDAICGAAGEISQICILYPLETVKVRCQADSINAVEVLARLFKHGFGSDVVRQLYSGFGSAALFSMVVGAVHWLSFCAAKRAALRVIAPPPPPLAPSAVSAAPVEAAAAAVAATAKAKKGKEESKKKGNKKANGKVKGEGLDGGAASEGATAAVASGSRQGAAASPATASSSPEAQQLSAKTMANLIASLAGALATALVESPVELFRHQAQAGLISGNLTREMMSAVRRGGPGALYFGFLPYCLESFPYDISELGTYSQLRDVYDDCTKPGNPLAPVMSKYLPPAAADIAVGAAAGAAAVMVSMPFDCIKTYIQTHAASTVTGGGVANGVRAFFVTGAGMVARKGPGALFVGVVPRLLQQVPSSTICWWTVEACGKALRPFMDESAEEDFAECTGH